MSTLNILGQMFALASLIATAWAVVMLFAAVMGAT